MTKKRDDQVLALAKVLTAPARLSAYAQLVRACGFVLYPFLVFGLWFWILNANPDLHASAQQSAIRATSTLLSSQQSLGRS